MSDDTSGRKKPSGPQPQGSVATVRRIAKIGASIAGVIGLTLWTFGIGQDVVFGLWVLGMPAFVLAALLFYALVSPEAGRQGVRGTLFIDAAFSFPFQAGIVPAAVLVVARFAIPWVGQQFNEAVGNPNTPLYEVENPLAQVALLALLPPLLALLAVWALTILVGLPLIAILWPSPRTGRPMKRPRQHRQISSRMFIFGISPLMLGMTLLFAFDRDIWTFVPAWQNIVESLAHGHSVRGADVQLVIGVVSTFVGIILVGASLIYMLFEDRTPKSDEWE